MRAMTSVHTRSRLTTTLRYSESSCSDSDVALTAKYDLSSICTTLALALGVSPFAVPLGAWRGGTKHSGGSLTAASMKRLTACCVAGGMSTCTHVSSSTNLADLVSRWPWYVMRNCLACWAATPRSDTIMRFAMVSVATTNAQLSPKISTNCSMGNDAFCSERTDKILDERVLASSHAAPRTSAGSNGVGSGDLSPALGPELCAIDSGVMELMGQMMLLPDDPLVLFQNRRHLVANLLNEIQARQH